MLEGESSLTDPGSISFGLQALKTATGIVKSLREVDRSLETADYKMQLADLMEALSEAKTRLIDAQEVNNELRDRIKELETIRDLRAEIVLESNVYVPVNEEVPRYGKWPWCSKCFETTGKLISLHHKVSSAFSVGGRSSTSYKWECPNCSSSVKAPRR